MWSPQSPDHRKKHRFENQIWVHGPLHLAGDPQETLCVEDQSSFLQMKASDASSLMHDAEECLHGNDKRIHDSCQGFATEAWTRGRWLLGLLILQSTSSFILDQYKDLLRDHLVVTLFLTMLVGAGGNAGNQSAIKVIRGLATGNMTGCWQSAKRAMAQQSAVGLLLGGGLSIAGYIRVWLYNGSPVNAFAISLSLFLIVMTSVILGTGLPFALHWVGIDSANAGTSIQVVMDILGVAITCFTCNFILLQFALSLKATDVDAVEIGMKTNDAISM